MRTLPSSPRRPLRAATLALLAMTVACDETPTDTSPPSPDAGPAASAELLHAGTPLDGAPEDLGVARSVVAGGIVFENEVSILSAPGPDGIAGTSDDLRFDSSWRGSRFFGFPSPDGDLWEALGLRFGLVDGGVAFTNSGGCLGSQRPSPWNNWSGGLRASFLDDAGRPVMASAVSFEVVNPPVTLRAYDRDGTLLATESLSTFRQFLTIHDVGPIAYAELTGDFWCIANRIRWNEIVEVDIDVKPGSDRNPVNLRATNGVVPVAILTTPDFDATDVDLTTVRFEGASETHVDKRSGEPRRHVEDVDGDGDLDLVIHLRVGETELTGSSSTGTLEGRTVDGTPIYGSDRVTPITGRRVR